ncbi:MAG: hypothetical protein GQ582_13385 [Methyloprofundus sp.]|nr:hypothetical protein [Methyloprofundus sp.]
MNSARYFPRSHAPRGNAYPNALRYVYSLASFILLALLTATSTLAAQQIPIAKNISELVADYNQPTDMASDAQGQLYVLDGMNSRVLIFSKTGEKIREINTSNSEHSFNRAMAIAIDKGILYIADSLQHRIRRFDLQGKWLSDIALLAPVIKVAAPAETTVKAEAVTPKQAALPEPVALLIRDNELIYSDRRWHRFCILDLATAKEIKCIGERGEVNGQFQYPFQIAQDRDHYLSIVDVLNARVQVFDRNGLYYSQTGKLSLDKMYRPNGNTFDLLGYQYISDSYLGTISLYLQGRFLGLLKDTQGKLLKFTTPTSLHYAPSGYLYVVDSQAQQIKKIQLTYQALAEFPENSDEVSRKNCVMCHYSWGSDGENKKLRDSQNVLPVAAINMCYSCHHGAVLDSRQAIPFGEQHSTVYDPDEKKHAYYKKPLREDEIPELYPHSDKNDLTCTSCHTPHNDNESQPTLYTENHNAWLRGADYGSEQCEACHESKIINAGREDAEKFGVNHPIGVKMHKPTKKSEHLSTDDPHLQKGLPKALIEGGAVLGTEEAIVCQSCHQVHQGKTENLLTQSDENSVLCASCHKRQAPVGKKGAHKAGVHPINVKPEDPMKNRGEKVTKVQCDSCHSVHKGTVGTDLYADEISDTEKLCVDCHKPQTAKDKKAAHKAGIHPVHVKPEEPMKNRGEKVTTVQCASCHSVHEGTANTELYPDNIKDKEELCVDCHEHQAPKDEKAARKAGVHPVNVDLEEPVEIRGEKVETVKCASCHSVHEGTADSFLYPDKIKDAEELCIGCHQRQHAKDEDEATRKGIHPMNLELDEQIKIEEVEVKKIGCLSCHAVHSGKPNTPSLLQDYRDGKLCENCHGGKQRVTGSDHDLRVVADKSQNQLEESPHQAGVCGSCHSLHRSESKNNFLSTIIKKPVGLRDKTAPGLKRDELCLNCHQEKAIGKDKPIEFYGHPFKDMVLRSDETVMPLVSTLNEEIEPLGGIACITCHEPHSWKPLKNPLAKNYPILNYRNQENIEGDILNSFLRHKGVVGTFCVDCHGIEALPKYKYYHHENKVRGIGVDYLQ